MTIQTVDGDSVACYAHHTPAHGWTVHVHCCGERGQPCANLVLTPAQAGELARTLVDVLPRDDDERAGLGPLGRLQLPPLPAVVGGPRRSWLEAGPAAAPEDQCGHQYHHGDGTDHSCERARGHGGRQHGDATHVWAAVS